MPHIGGYIQTEKKAPGKSAFSLCQWHIYLPKIKNCNLLSCPLSALKVKMWKCFKRKYPNIPLQPTRITLAFGMGLPETWKQMRPFSQLWASVGQNQEPRNQSLFIRSTTIWQGSQEHSAWKRDPLQQMGLGKLDNHTKKIEFLYHSKNMSKWIKILNTRRDTPKLPKGMWGGSSLTLVWKRFWEWSLKHKQKKAKPTGGTMSKLAPVWTSHQALTIWGKHLPTKTNSLWMSCFLEMRNVFRSKRFKIWLREKEFSSFLCQPSGGLEPAAAAYEC